MGGEVWGGVARRVVFMMNHPGFSPGDDWSLQAEAAAADVHQRFGHRLAGLPGTWIGSLIPPTSGSSRLRTLQPPWSQWHYWWQAHYVDAVVDAGFAQLRHANRRAARLELQRAEQLLRGILFRNFGRFPNYFYDDMAWLALAAGRLNDLSLRLLVKPSPLATFASTTLTRQLHGAHDDVLGGGLHWSRKRDYKNAPVNGPAALHFARTGETERAAAIINWLRRELFDPATGLYLDGIHPSASGRDVETTIYTYNQGPVLAALLELGGVPRLRDAAALIEAIRSQLYAPDQGLRLECGGDGSLFTGILCRYLALAAQDPRLPSDSRETASSMVRDTAAAIRDTEPWQLSGALQRWMIFAAAATL